MSQLFNDLTLSMCGKKKSAGDVLTYFFHNTQKTDFEIVCKRSLLEFEDTVTGWKR